MVTRLKAKDLPEPWFPTRHIRVSEGKQSQPSAKAIDVDDFNTNDVAKEMKKRGQPRKKKERTELKPMKERNKRRSLPASAEDLLLRCSKIPSQDVEELRRKREQDAIACGRTVIKVNAPPQGKYCLPTLPVTSSLLEPGHDKAKQVACPLRSSSPTSLEISKSFEDKKLVDEHASNFFEECNDDPEPAFVRRPGKEHVDVEVKEQVKRHEGLPNTVLHEHAGIDSGRETESKDTYGQPQVGMRRQQTSPREEQSDDDYRERLYRQSLSPNSRSPVHPEHYYGYTCRSPPRKFPRSSPVQDCRSHRRIRSRSPRNRRDKHYWRTGKTVTKYDGDDRNSDQVMHGDYLESKRMLSREYCHHRQYESPSPDDVPRRRRQDSEDSGRRQSRRAWTPDYWRSPPRSSRKRSSGTPALRPEEDEDIIGPSRAMERKERRRKQGIRESEEARRRLHGQKPFYLILDREGKPYSLGKPAWITQINKLAAGLDPSCTHIRKQTFEDVQTFKDRLNDDFEYSGALNEDYLRGLMGKAVTKRRGELISLIQRNGERPTEIDIEVWKRLEKLADSKQRQEKSEQGRHANACRRTFGRTGSIGMNGVREKLRSQLQRSPDPDEIEEEMQRDKGYGGRKRKMPALAMKSDRNSEEVISGGDNFRSPAMERSMQQKYSGASHAEPSTRRGRAFSQRIEERTDCSLEEMGTVTRRMETEHERVMQMESKKRSTKDYIRELEAEIQRLQAQNATAVTSVTVIPSQSPVSARYDSTD